MIGAPRRRPEIVKVIVFDQNIVDLGEVESVAPDIMDVISADDEAIVLRRNMPPRNQSESWLLSKVMFEELMNRAPVPDPYPSAIALTPSAITPTNTELLTVMPCEAVT